MRADARVRRTAAPAVGLDIALVLVFVLLGRRSHDEGLTLAGIVRTAWPFLVGLGIGWLALVARPATAGTALWPAGVTVWLSTLIVGMTLRALAGQGVALSFILVATVVLAMFLLGWRALYRLIGRGR